MESLVITPRSKDDAKLLKSMAKKMGFRVDILTDEDKEDLGLLKAMLQGKKTKYVSKEEVMRNLRS